VKGSQAVHDSESMASNQIAAMVESKDKMTNSLNASLLSAHAELSGVLSTPGQVYQQNVAGLVAGTVSAAAQGANLGVGLKNA